MSAADELFTATDCRRAAALIAHAGAGDIAGMRLVLTEAHEADEMADLAAALAATCLDLNPWLRTTEGLALLRDIAAGLTAAEDEGAS